MGLEASDCLLVGDRIETDIRMGKEAGMKTALVMTGVTDAKTLEASSVHPDHVIDSIADLEDMLR
jgi:4-nitrophenyl phosphatase